MTGLLERDAELGAVGDMLGAAAAGRGGLLLIEGPAGIGKSQLVANARVVAGEHGLRVLAARGSEMETAFPFGVARQLFEPALVDPDDRAALTAGAAAPAGELLAGATTAAALPGGDPAFTLLHGLYWLCAGLAQRAPVCLAIDDAHWADGGSLRFLSYLANRVAELPIAIVVAARPAEAGDELRALLDRPDATVLTPAPLGPGATRALLAERLGPDRVTDPLVDACQEATGGNPFLLRELAAALDSTGADPARVRDLRPDAVRRAALARLGRLDADSRALARAVAVLGDEVDLRRAARLADLSEDAAAVAAERLAEHAILRRERPLAFVHALVRAVVRDDIGPAERSRVAGRAARELHADGAGDAAVAAQLVHTDPAGDPWVVERLIAAAERASASGAPETAAELLERALREPPAPEHRGNVLFALGAAEARAPRIDMTDAVAHLRDAVALADPGLETVLRAAELGQALLLGGETLAAAQVIDDLLDGLDPMFAELGHMIQGVLITASFAHPEARALVRSHPLRFEGPPPGTAPQTMGERAWFALRAQERCFEPQANYVEARELARAGLSEGALLAEHTSDSPVFYLALNTLMLTDDHERAYAIYSDAIAEARTRGSLRGQAMASCWRCLSQLQLGRVADAISDGRTALALVEAGGMMLGLPAGGAFLAEALLAAGEQAEAVRLIEDTRRDSLAMSGESILFEYLLDTAGRIALLQGRFDDALEYFEHVGRRRALWPIANPCAIQWQSAAALALAALGRTEEALQQAHAELAAATSWGGPRPLGIAQRRLGMIEGAAGIDRIRTAVALHAEHGLVYEHAISLVELGSALRRSGARTEAREPLRDGLAIARQAGAYAVAERAHTELEAAGARPRKMIRAGVDALTPSELRVARMAAAGQSNRDIAAALFVTVRTVETHLNHSYAKLGVAGRADLAAALA